MNRKDKEILFSAFLEKWESQFNKIPSILKYLLTYPEFVKGIDGLKSFDIDELKEIQLEWVSLVNQFDNPIESSFFKEYWVPIRKGGIAPFIDLSSDSLPLIDTHYFTGEPNRLFKIEIARDISQFLVDISNPEFDLKDHFDKIRSKKWEMVTEIIQKERHEQGFIGECEPSPVNHPDIFFEDEDGGWADNAHYTLKENCIIFYPVKEAIVALLPYESEITLEYFNATNCKFENVCDKVKNIKSLVYLIQAIGYIEIFSFSFRFNSNKSFYAKFRKSKFTIKHADVDLLNSLLDKFNALTYQRKMRSSE